MNEEAIRDAYNLFVGTGYTKSYEDFKALISSNPEALQDAYGLFTGTGYNKDIESFKSLMGVGGAMPQEEVKKKDESIVEKAQGLLAGTTDLPSVVSSLDSSPSFLETIDQKPWEKNFVRRTQGSDLGDKFIPGAISSISERDEGMASHKMASAEVDGKYIAFPTIVQKKGEDTLTELSVDEALNYALENNEFLSFSTPYKAQAYAEGEYKRGTLLEDFSRPDFFNKAINMITPDFIDNIEEVVVPQMNYQFGPLGFKFEESGATGDWMIATAPDGSKKEFSLDPSFGFGAESTSAELQKWIKDNSPITGLERLESEYTGANKRYTSQAEFRKETYEINKELEDFKISAETYFYEKSKVDKELEAINNLPVEQKNSPENVQKYQAIMAKSQELDTRRQSLTQRENVLKSRGKSYDGAVGRYMLMKAEQGQDVGAYLNSFLEGLSKMGSTTVINIEADIGGALAEFKPYQEKANTLLLARQLGMEVPLDLLEPNTLGGYRVKDEKAWADWYNSLSGNEKSALESKFKDQVKKDTKYGKNGEMGALEAAREGYKFYFGSGATDEYKQKISDDSFLTMALLGVTESLPAMIGGGGTLGWAQRGFQMYSLATDNIYQEMEKNPDFKNISENEKILIAAPIGIAEATLETIGLRNLVANKGLMNGLILRAMGKAGATTTAKTFGDLVKNEVESMGGRALLTLAGASLAEAETGAAQQISEYAFKDIYNEIKGKDMFQTPDFLSADYFMAIGKSAAAEAVGGLLLGIPNAAGAAYTQKGYKGMSDVMFESFERFSQDENLQSAFIVDLKDKVSRGQMSPKDAKEALNNYRNSVGLLRALPPDLTLEGKKEAMNLLKERRDLEQMKEGKDKALVKKIDARIEAINGELDALTDNPTTSTRPTGPSGNEVQILTDEEEQRRTTLEEAIANANGMMPDGDTATEVKIGEDLLKMEDAQAELAALNAKIAEAQTNPTGSTILSTVETITEALNSLSPEDRTSTTFTQEDGTELPVMGNESVLANLFKQVRGIAEDNITDWQQSVLDAVNVSLKTQLDEEAIEQASLQAGETIQPSQQTGTPVVTVNGEKTELNDGFFKSLVPDKLYQFVADTIDQVPQAVRQLAKRVDIETRKKIIGLPIGKKGQKSYYTYTLTGDQIAPLQNEIVSSQAKRATTKAEIISNTVRSLTSAFPDLAIKNFKSLSDMKAYVEAKYADSSISSQLFGGVGGMIIRDENDKALEILMNEEDSTETTLPHEAWHAILIRAFGENEALFKEFRDGIIEILNGNFPEIVKSLEEFSATPEYQASNEQAQEWLVELGGLLTASGITAENLDKKARTLLEEIKMVFNVIARRITGQPMFLEDATPDDILDFMVTISERMSKGQDISQFFREAEQRESAAPRRASLQKGGTLQKAEPKTSSLKDIDVKRIRTLSRAGSRVSKGLSVSSKDNQKVVQEAPDLSLEYVKENAPKVFIENANLLAKYPIVRAIKTFGTVKTIEQAQEVYDVFTRQTANNLKYLMDNFRQDLREIATLWYDGANILAQNFSKQYGITTEQAAGIIASLSPQKDWYQNVRLAEMVMMAFKDNPVMTKEMVAKQKEIIQTGLKEYTKDLNKAKLAYKNSRSKANAEALKKEMQSTKDYTEKTQIVLDNLSKLIGMDMNTAPDYAKPYYVRLFHEINTTKDYDILSPDGRVIGVAKTKKKNTPNAKVAWGSYTEIGKATAIYLDGSQENITRTLGEMHKIRNFYNNIIDPMSADKDVTMDTHAVAAALMLPLSGKAKEVKANFGTGTSNSAPLGIKGLYYAFAEGYNLAAEETGLLPRQVQSITWEAVRGLFTDDFKRDSKKVAAINQIVDNYVNKKITVDEARNQITESAGGIKDPSWAGGPLQEGTSGNVQGETAGTGSGGPKSDTVGPKQRGPRVKASKQIVGEKAEIAQNVRDNLQVAKEMEAEGENAKTIRIATGWEKGAEGKWRYEVPDNIPFLKDTVRQVSKFISENQIEDNVYQKANYFLPAELLSLYPQLNEVTIQFNKNENEQQGNYNPKTKTISVNIGVYPQNTVSVLLHEIQHVIQDIEGFERGGNVEMMNTPNDVLESLADKLPFKTLSREERSLIKNEYEKNGLKRLPILPTIFDVTSDSPDVIEDFIDKLDVLIKLFPNETSYQNLQDALALKLMEMGGNDVAFENYLRLAGEVEARNVQARMNMTPEQRRNTTLQETEDTERSKQTVRSKQTGVKASKQQGGTLQEVRKIAQRYNMNNSGFSPAQVNEFAMSRELEPFGYSAKRAAPDANGRQRGVYILNPKGRFYNPFKAKFQRINLGAGNLGANNVENIPGYARMLAIANGIIERSLLRGRTQAEIMENVMKYVRGSKVYEIADDTQREQLERNVETEFGKRQKSSPSVARLFGTIKDITKITMTEKSLLNKQFRDLARGARESKIAFMKAEAELAKQIKELVLSGQVKTKQVASIIRRFAALNVFNEDAVDKFVEYMTKVFEDANYDQKIQNARKKLTTAKKNIRSKIGIAEAAGPALIKLFSINPNLIPDSVLDKYIALVDSFGSSAAVLSIADATQVVDDVNDILTAIDEEVSLVEELAILFDNFVDKVLDANGKINFAETLIKMLEEKEITEDDVKLMKKYKNLIIPKVQKAPKTEAEIEAEKRKLITAIKGLTMNVEALPTRDERNLARELQELLTAELLKQLSVSQLENIVKLIDNINNGYLPHYAELTVERLDSKKDKSPLINSIKTGSALKIEKAYARVKKFVTRSKQTATFKMIERGTLYNLEQLFGDFKTKDIFNSLFKRLAQGQAFFDSEMNTINKTLDRARARVASSYKNKPNDALFSSFKMMAYMLQLEYQSNPGSSQVQNVFSVIKATIKHIDAGNTRFGEREVEMLQEILDKYNKVVGQDKNGNDILEINAEELYNTFNSAEKDAIKVIQKLNEELREKAVYTAAVIRGDRINPLNNYVHHYVMNEFNADENATGVETSEAYNNAMRPSTRAVSLEERTKSVKPLNFDVFAATQRGAKYVMLDYSMTKAIRTARKTLNETRVELEKNGRIPKKEREIYNALNTAFEEVVRSVLTNNFISNSIGDEVVDFISKAGYRAILASVPRFISELTSNFGTIIFDPASFAKGVALFGKLSAAEAIEIMKASKSVQVNRLFSGQSLSGKYIDTSILSQTTGIVSGSAQSDIQNVVNQIYNNTLKKYKNFIELTADTLISTPDKTVMRPYWFGVYANVFKQQTGKELDLAKLKANDETYINENKEALEKAAEAADRMSVRVGATDNPFMGILKGTVKPNQSSLTRGFNNFNNFMTRFAIYEYTTAREGIYAAMGQGMITRAQGVALLAGVTTRMTVYTLLTNILGSTMVGAFVDEEEPDDEKSFMQKFGQALASTATGLILGRNFGNATKGIVNYGVEEINKEFLTDLREGEYDPYEDYISYSYIPRPKEGQDISIRDLITNMMGSFGPAIKTTDLMVKKAFADEKKEADAIERSDYENMVRIPLEVLGNVGMIPLYKDVRKIVMADIYKDIDKASKEAEKKAAKEKGKLHGYKNRGDLERYAPELYELEFGKNSPNYEEEQARKKLEKEKNDLERKMTDEMYNYVPKEKKGFGSKKFGEKSEGKKFGSGSGFGSKKFGQ